MVMGVAVAGAVFSGREAVYLQDLQGLYSFVQGSTVLGAGLNAGADIASGGGATVVTVANKAFQLALRDAYLTGGIISAIGALLAWCGTGELRGTQEASEGGSLPWGPAWQGPTPSTGHGQPN